MARSFSDEEKVQIKEQIFQVSKKMFEEKGFQKTTVDAIVESVGIAKGSFYTFYPSKEVLFFEILESIERRMHESAMNFIGTRVEEVPFPQAFKELILMQHKQIASEPLLFKAFDMQLIERIWRKLPREMQIENIEFDNRKIGALLDLAKASGYECAVEADVVAGLLRSMVFMLLNKDIVGSSYDSVSSLIVEATIDKIFV